MSYGEKTEQEERKGLTPKRQKGIWLGDENVLYLDSAGSYTTVYSSQNCHDKHFKKGEFYSLEI